MTEIVITLTEEEALAALLPVTLLETIAPGLQERVAIDEGPEMAVAYSSWIMKVSNAVLRIRPDLKELVDVSWVGLVTSNVEQAKAMFRDEKGDS